MPTNIIGSSRHEYSNTLAYWVKIKFTDEIHDWCIEQYGIMGGWYYGYGNCFYFFSEYDRTIFLIRWAGET